jgi:hypothetical protein
VLRSSITQDGAAQQEDFPGQILALETKVIVTFGVGIAVTALFFTSFALLIVVLLTTRPRYRPLHLAGDPAKIVSAAALIMNQGRTRETLPQAGLCSRMDAQNLLKRRKYQTTHNSLHDVTRGDIVVPSEYMYSR